MIRRLVPSCAACGKASKGHICNHFAVAIANEERLERVRNFLLLLREHSWGELLGSNSFDVNDTAIGAYAMECAETRTATTFALISEAGVGGRSRLVALELLESQVAQELTLAIDERKKAKPSDFLQFKL